MVHHTATRRRTVGLRARLFLALAVAPFAIGVFNGNTFALHVGLDGHAARVAASEASSLAVGSAAASAAVDPRAALGTLTAGRFPGDHDAQHLLHAVGACTALLAAGVLLLLWRRLRQLLPTGDVEPAHRCHCRVAVFGEWLPPPLSPPTSSPVIRT